MATVDEAVAVLGQLRFPRQQRNERSALALLALLDLTPDRAWSEAEDPLRGITQLMSLMAEHYGKRYAPNTRETVRRQTVHLNWAFETDSGPARDRSVYASAIHLA